MIAIYELWQNLTISLSKHFMDWVFIVFHIFDRIVDKVDSIRVRKVIIVVVVVVVVVAVLQCVLFHLNGIFSLLLILSLSLSFLSTSFYACVISEKYWWQFLLSVGVDALSHWIYFIPDDENEWFGWNEKLGWTMRITK